MNKQIFITGSVEESKNSIIERVCKDDRVASMWVDVDLRSRGLTDVDFPIQREFDIVVIVTSRWTWTSTQMQIHYYDVGRLLSARTAKLCLMDRIDERDLMGATSLTGKLGGLGTLDRIALNDLETLVQQADDNRQCLKLVKEFFIWEG
jgi:hypothetical protein